MMSTDDEEWIPAGPSRSQRKREAEALQRVGEALLRLTPAQREQLPLPAVLRAAVDEALRLNARGALKRQRQYIGRLMREIDVAPIEAALEALQRKGHADTERFHRIEGWRDRLVAEGDAALGEALTVFPSAERDRLRTLVRNAHKARDGDQAGKTARALFRYLRALVEEGPDAPAAHP